MIITLTTDFGHADAFVGAMKGAILSIAPRAAIVDLCHDVPAHDVLRGAMLLEDAYAYFPAGTIHAAVVDPGVGSSRAAVAVETERYFFVGPDNGLLDLALRGDKVVRAVRLDNPRYHRAAVSATFHGRDIFAPAAAHLARGVKFGSLGSKIERPDRLVPLPIPRPSAKGRDLQAHVLHVDRFGNLIADLKLREYQAWNPDARGVSLRVGRRTIGGIRRAFADVPPGACVAYFGGTERLEIAVNLGRAAEVLRARAGSAIRLRLE